MNPRDESQPLIESSIPIGLLEALVQRGRMDLQHLPESVADRDLAPGVRLVPPTLAFLRAISKAAKACTLELPTASIGAAA
jgi:hypothetical protein